MSPWMLSTTMRRLPPSECESILLQLPERLDNVGLFERLVVSLQNFRNLPRNTGTGLARANKIQNRCEQLQSLHQRLKRLTAKQRLERSDAAFGLNVKLPTSQFLPHAFPLPGQKENVTGKVRAVRPA